jgi:hypothetical protein
MGGIAIMTVDPGGKSGVAQGLFFDEADSVESACRRALRKGGIKSWEVHGEPFVQAHIIAHMWLEFQFRACVNLSIPADHVCLALEDFQLRQRSADLSPVSVTYGIKTLLTKIDIDQAEKTDHGRIHARTVRWPIGEPYMQAPSDAMRFATNARLRQWGLYAVIGKPISKHRRDAVRHLCVRLSTMLES